MLCEVRYGHTLYKASGEIRNIVKNVLPQLNKNDPHGHKSRRLTFFAICAIFLLLQAKTGTAGI